MKPDERTYVWYRPGGDGRIEGVSTVLLPQLGALPLSSGLEGARDPFGLQFLEVDAARHPDLTEAPERFRVINGELRDRASDQSSY